MNSEEIARSWALCISVSVMVLLYLLSMKEIEIPNHDQTVVLKHTREVRRCLALQCSTKLSSFSFHCSPRWWTRGAFKQQEVKYGELSLQKASVCFVGHSQPFICLSHPGMASGTWIGRAGGPYPIELCWCTSGVALTRIHQPLGRAKATLSRAVFTTGSSPSPAGHFALKNWYLQELAVFLWMQP